MGNLLREELVALKLGEMAPEFELPAVEGERQFQVKLSDFRGKKHVVVSFHPLDWTPT
jgi:thioredoxin-dependent peroxiredoxin